MEFKFLYRQYSRKTNKQKINGRGTNILSVNTKYQNDRMLEKYF